MISVFLRQYASVFLSQRLPEIYRVVGRRKVRDEAVAIALVIESAFSAIASLPRRYNRNSVRLALAASLSHVCFRIFGPDE